MCGFRHFTWNHTVAAFVKAALDLHCEDYRAVVLARGLTLIYTGPSAL